MRIALNGWFWDQPHTGSGQYLRRLVGSLRRIAPEDQIVLVLPPRIQSPQNVPEGVEIVLSKGRDGNLGKVWFEQRTFPATAGKAKADLAHVPYWGSPLTSPVPLVVSVLDVIPLALPEYASGVLPRLYTSLQSAAARGAGHILTISEAAKTDIQKYLGIPAESITVTPLAADESFHPKIGSERDEEVRQKYNLPDRYTLYMGSYDSRKQVSQLIAAYTFVARPLGDEVPLLLAGRIPEWGRPPFPDIPSEIEAAGLSEVTRFLGMVDEADKSSLYRMAEVFVFPTRYEGFGLPVLEAMSSGTPVVANQIPVIEEVAGDAAYLVENSNSRAMGAAILSLLVDDSLKEDLRTRGLAQATRFNWRKTASATLEVYHRVIAAAK